jgi:hypothetical protein
MDRGHFPPDPYACLGATTSHTASRLVEMFVNGPVDAAFSSGGDLYLSDDQFVIRLTRNHPNNPADNGDRPYPLTPAEGRC